MHKIVLACPVRSSSFTDALFANACSSVVALRLDFTSITAATAYTGKNLIPLRRNTG
jgi:hypothetical protein